MSTFADIIGEARTLLQDKVTPYRYSDSDLLVGANDSIKMIRKVRPDLFFGKYKVGISDYLITDSFPIGDEYKMAVRDYIVAHSQLTESEDAAGERAKAFITLFERGVGL